MAKKTKLYVALAVVIIVAFIAALTLRERFAAPSLQYCSPTRCNQIPIPSTTQIPINNAFGQLKSITLPSGHRAFTSTAECNKPIQGRVNYLASKDNINANVKCITVMKPSN